MNIATLMKIINDIHQWRSACQHIPAGMSVGLVPTMGNLHKGHQALIKLSQLHNDITVVSSFVNPTQFDQKEDYIHYPKTPEQDRLLCQQCAVNYLFLPSEETMYPNSYEIQVKESKDSLLMEGKFRPGHFDGVLSIVLKLLNIFSPTRAYFGEKDYQQFLLIKKMAQSFFIKTDIISCPIIRDDHGVALSSRNHRLSKHGYQQLKLFRRLFTATSDASQLTSMLKEHNIIIEYIEDVQSRRFAALRIEGIRLIDNTPIPEEN